MRLRPAALAAALVALAAPTALAHTLRVPSEAHPDIQSAVNAAHDGDTILVDAGTYTSGASINEKHRLRIRGLPGAVIQSASLLLNDCEQVTIEGIAFEDPGDTGHAIYAVECPRLSLRNLGIDLYGNDAIRLFDCDGARITGCTVSNAGAAGLHDSGSEDLVVEKCTFTGNGGWSIHLSTDEENGSHRARVSKNVVTGTGVGIAAGGEDLRIEGNTVTLDAGTGILVGGAVEAPRALVQKNAVSVPGNASRGLDVATALGRVARNRITGGTGLGMIIEGDGNRIEGNSVIGGGQTQGFHCDGIDLRITGNLAQGVLGVSFHVAQGAGSTVSKNRALDAGNTGFYVSQQNAILTKNAVEGAGYAFDLFAQPMTLTGNSATGSAVADLISSFSENQFTLSRNRFETFLWDHVFEIPI